MSEEASVGRIALVDDDQLFLESLGQNLRDAGFDVVTFDGGLPALRGLDDRIDVDLYLLDWKMPDKSGIEVLRELRARGIETPVVFLTALGDQLYEETALRSGAVDFVEKSRSFTILRNRVELILHGAKASESTAAETRAGGAVQIGSLQLDRDSHRAFWKQQQVDLTLTEFQMVAYLAERDGRDVRYRELYDLVHGKDFMAGSGSDGYRANVRTFIKRVRQKLKDIDPDFDAIENYAGFGYRWRSD